MREDLIKIEINPVKNVNISIADSANTPPFCIVRLSTIKGLKPYKLDDYEVDYSLCDAEKGINLSYFAYSDAIFKHLSYGLFILPQRIGIYLLLFII